MTRVIHIDSPKDVGAKEFIRPRANYRRAFRWLVDNRSIGTMVAVSALAGMGYTIMTTLAPTYVADVLETDPANTVFIVGIAGVGMTVSLALVPYFVNRFGERVVAGIGFSILSVGLVGLGLIESGVLEFLTPLNPFHWIDNLIGFFELNEKTELAMLVSLPIGVGAGLTDNSVKTYLNRRVPVVFQGRTFATRNLTESALTIPPLLAVSALAVWLGISVVLFIMPIVFYLVAISLLRLAARLAAGTDTFEPGTGVVSTYWHTAETEDLTSMDDESA
jgi:MFS family permease